MAMIQCPECGATVSDQSANCVKCGYPIQRAGSVLVIERKKTFKGSALKFAVFVDGVQRDILKNGETTVIETPGAAGIEIVPLTLLGSQQGKSLIVQLGNHEQRKVMVEAGLFGIKGNEVSFS
jgi:hypothetical protein